MPPHVSHLLPSPLIHPHSLLFAISGSVLLHLVLMGSLPKIFKDEDRVQRSIGFDVILVNNRSLTLPDDVQALAQQTLDGGGDQDDPKTRSKGYEVISEFEQPAIRLETVTPQNIEKVVHFLQVRKKNLLAEMKNLPPNNPNFDPNALPFDQNLSLSSDATSEIQGEISQKLLSYNKRPRKMFIGARTLTIPEAQYIESWRRKIEQVGTLNFPREGIHPIYGKLTISVSIRSNGSLEKIEIDRPSPIKSLNEAARRILKKAAPYEAFPSKVRKKADMLVITRTWFFTRDNILVTEQ